MDNEINNLAGSEIDKTIPLAIIDAPAPIKRSSKISKKILEYLFLIFE
ncbi:hypothetical protein HZA97_09695 [Candidatus Woesearchaeota archaeon]|nr:hypothetical protein [Candidatus Woesearchaeota archaeon]